MAWKRTLWLASLLALAGRGLGCPDNQTLSAYCACESSYNGILLDCSNSNAALTLNLLRQNQVQLGLIQTLTLRNASLVLLPNNFLKGLYVKRLDLSQNQIDDVHQQSFAGLESILQSVNMSHNRLDMLPVVALDGLNGLTELDLSHNQIGDIDTKQTLRNTPKLLNLDLSSNKICNMQKSVFDGVKSSVQTLNLGHNCLQQVPASSLRGFKQLLALHLHKNQIQNIDPLAFMNLPQLNLINLAQNQIHAIHKQSFLNVPRLRLMYLSDNHLSELVPMQFHHFETLEMLDLTKNHLSKIPAGAFANMGRLNQLYLGENQISVIENGAFTNSSLVVLLMPYNLMRRLNPDMFEGMTYLQQLSFKGNQIEQVAQNTFYQLPSLVMLDLAGNQIRSLAPSTFLAQLNMFLIDLSSNRLPSVPYNAFNKRIVTVVLQENPLVCTERVHLLQNGVGIYVQDSVDAICNNNQLQPNSGAAREPSLVQSAAAPTAPPRPADGGVPTQTPFVPNKNTPLPQQPSLHGTDLSHLQQFLPPGFDPAGLLGPPQVQSGTTPGASRPQSQAPPFPAGPRNIAPAAGIPSSFVPAALDPAAIADAPVRVPQLGNAFVTQPPPVAPVGSRARRPPRPQPQPQPQQPQPTTQRTNLPNANRPPQPEQEDRRPEENDNVRHPFPIPFLQHNPVAQAFPHTSTPGPATLPPGIILASTAYPPNRSGSLPPWTPPNRQQRPEQSTAPTFTRAQPSDTGNWQPPFPPQNPQVPPFTSAQQPNNNNQLSSNEQQQQQRNWHQTLPGLPPGVDIPQKKKPTTQAAPGQQQVEQNSVDSAAFPYESDASVDPSGGPKNTGSATTTIVVCLTVVVVVMVAVFVTLCVVRHKSHSASRRMASSSSQASSAAAARTSAYVAAQAAYAAQQYGSLVRPVANNRNTGTLPKSSAGNNQHTWIYTPGSYSSASNYYK